MRELAKITARLQVDNSKGIMIIKAIWQRESSDIEDDFIPVLLKENRRMLTCRACYGGESLITTMLLNPSVAGHPEEERLLEYHWDNKWHIFNEQEVTEFIDDVGDNNPIHRGDKAVVPGFLLMEKIKDKLPKNISRLALSFRNAVRLGDPLYFDIQAGKVNIMGRKEFITGTYE